ncbi:hypothetical protein ASF23_07000 [Curtobacterium sp. Leaf261]|nr:hypothetical protein ASF23_07000 [Curtobacterium sp. Leaf261]
MLDIRTRWSRSTAAFAVSVDPGAAREALVSAIAGTRGLHVRYVTERTVVLMSSLGWATWGELVTVELQPKHGGGTDVSVRTAPPVPLTLFDFGQGAKDIRVVHDVLTRAAQ